MFCLRRTWTVGYYGKQRHAARRRRSDKTTSHISLPQPVRTAALGGSRVHGESDAIARGWLGVGKWLHPQVMGPTPSGCANHLTQLQPVVASCSSLSRIRVRRTCLRCLALCALRGATRTEQLILVAFRHSSFNDITHYLLLSTTSFHRRPAVPIAVAFASAFASASPQPWLLPA